MSSSEDPDFDPQDDAESSSNSGQSTKFEYLPTKSSDSPRSAHLNKDDALQFDKIINASRSNLEYIEVDDEQSNESAPRTLKDDPKSDEHPLNAEGTYFTRPNRFTGAASTWRHWTEEERAIAESLDQQRATDLSIHLFNSHNLKAKPPTLPSKPSSKVRGKQRATSRDESHGVDGKDFALPVWWSAWPLPPDEVPREDLMPNLGLSEALRAPADSRPSAILEECLIAHTSREARNHWNSRQEESERDSKDPDDLDSKTELAAGLANSPEDSKSDPLLEEGSPDIEMFFSQPLNQPDEPDSPSAPEDEDDNMYNINPEAIPVPLVDDDKARKILLPSTRHIISKVDDLLLGLHKARQAYAPRNSRDESFQSEAEGATDTDASQARSRSRSRGRKRKRKSSDSPGPVDSEISARATSSARKRKGTHRLGLRDWSDVMGMALLTGWDPEVVERASARCASLLGQNMLFRTFKEGYQGEKSFFTEQLATGQEPDSAEEDQESSIGDNFGEATDSEQEATSKARRSSSRRSKICPYQWCPRHTKPFGRATGVDRHVANVHANDLPPMLSKRAASSKPSSEIDTNVLEKDEIFCPVPMCKRQKRTPFPSAARMYDHIRRMHTNVDVEEVKKARVQVVGERRGGYRWAGDRDAAKETTKLVPKTNAAHACNACFERRWMCDFQKPKCKKCSRHGLDCEYDRDLISKEEGEEDEDSNEGNGPYDEGDGDEESGRNDHMNDESDSSEDDEGEEV